MRLRACAVRACKALLRASVTPRSTLQYPRTGTALSVVAVGRDGVAVEIHWSGEWRLLEALNPLSNPLPAPGAGVLEVLTLDKVCTPALHAPSYPDPRNPTQPCVFYGAEDVDTASGALSLPFFVSLSRRTP